MPCKSEKMCPTLYVVWCINRFASSFYENVYEFKMAQIYDTTYYPMIYIIFWVLEPNGGLDIDWTQNPIIVQGLSKLCPGAVQ